MDILAISETMKTCMYNKINRIMSDKIRLTIIKLSMKLRSFIENLLIVNLNVHQLEVTKRLKPFQTYTTNVIVF